MEKEEKVRAAIEKLKSHGNEIVRRSYWTFREV